MNTTTLPAFRGSRAAVKYCDQRQEAGHQLSNFWDNIARSTVRELAKAAGLRVSNEHAVADLTATYGPQPTTEFVDEFWLVLRDGWLTRSAPHRQAVVTKMLALGRGNPKLATRTRTGQIAYLKSLRRSPALAEVVLEVFLQSGQEERQPPVFVDAPASPEEQRERFYESIAASLQRLTPSNIDTLEVTLLKVALGATAEMTIPAADSADAAGKLVSVLLMPLLLDETWEASGSDLHDYQRIVLEMAPRRVADARSAAHLAERYWAAIRPAFEDPDATAETIALWAAAVFMGLLAYDRPEDAPDGFVSDILRLQRRFLVDADGADDTDVGGREGPSDLDEAITEALGQVSKSSQPQGFETGAVGWSIYAGSAVVRVLRLPYVEGRPPIIRFFSPLLQGVPMSSELLDTLNRVNGDELLHKLYWLDGTVLLEYCMAVDSFSPRLFLWTLMGFLGDADHLDTALKDRFGGALFGDDERASFDA